MKKKATIFLISMVLLCLISCKKKYNYDTIIDVNQPISDVRYDYMFDELKNGDSSALISIDDQLVINNQDSFDFLSENQMLLRKPQNTSGIFKFENYYAPIGLLVLDDELKEELVLILDGYIKQFEETINFYKKFSNIKKSNIGITSDYKFILYNFEDYSGKINNSENAVMFEFDYDFIKMHNSSNFFTYFKKLDFFIPKTPVVLNQYIINIKTIIDAIKNDLYICPIYEINKIENFYNLSLKEIRTKQYYNLYYNSYSFDKNEIKFEKISTDIHFKKIDYGFECVLNKYNYYNIFAKKNMIYYLVFESSQTDSIIIDFVKGAILTKEIMNDRYSRYNYITEGVTLSDSKYIIKKLELGENESINLRLIKLGDDVKFLLFNDLQYLEYFGVK